MFFLIGNLIKTLSATLNRTNERLFSGVDSQMIKEALRLLEEFSAPGVIARVHCGLALCIRKRISIKLELGEEAGARHRQLFMEAGKIESLTRNTFDIRFLSQTEPIHQSLENCFSWIFIVNVGRLLSLNLRHLLTIFT